MKTTGHTGLVLALFALLLLFAVTGELGTQPRVAAQDLNPSELCSANDDFGIGTHGGCVSLFEANFNSSAFFSALCQDILDMGSTFFPTHGACVKFFNELKGPPTPTPESLTLDMRMGSGRNRL